MVAPKIPRVSLRQARARAKLTNKRAAQISGIAPSNVARLERPGSLEKATVGTLRRYLQGIGLRLVAISADGGAGAEGAIEIVDPAKADDPRDPRDA